MFIFNQKNTLDADVSSWGGNITDEIDPKKVSQDKINKYLYKTKTFNDPTLNKRFYQGKDINFYFSQNFFDLFSKITGEFSIYLEGDIQVPNEIEETVGRNNNVYNRWNYSEGVQYRTENAQRDASGKVTNATIVVRDKSDNGSVRSVWNKWNINMGFIGSGDFRVELTDERNQKATYCKTANATPTSINRTTKDGNVVSPTYYTYNNPDGCNGRSFTANNGLKLIPATQYRVKIKYNGNAKNLQKPDYFTMMLNSIVTQATSFLIADSDKFCMDEPSGGSKYKVVDKEFLDAFKNKQKDLNWLWGSPLRARQVGKSGQFCIIAKDENGGGGLTSGDDKVAVALEYEANYSDETDTNNPKKKKETSTDFITDANNYPTISVPSNGYCFDIPNMDKKITKNAKFKVFTAQDGTFSQNILNQSPVSTSDTFSIRPAGLKFEIYNRTNNGLSSTGSKLDKQKLFAGKTYYFSVKALGANNAELPTRNTDQTHVAKGTHSTIKTGKYDTQLSDVFKTKNKTCPNQNLPLPGLNFTNNESRTGGFIFWDLMEFDFKILDNKWTAVDDKNTNGYGRECKRSGTQSGGFTRDLVDCDIELADTLKFIPAGIKATFNGITNANNGYTYLDDFNATSSDESLKQKATLNLSIKAVAQNGTELSNFTTNCYAEPVSFTLNYSNVGDINSTDPTLRSNITAKRTRIPFIDNSPNKDQPLAKRIALATNTTGLNLDDTSTNYNEANKLRGISNGYSKFYPTENKNKMPLKAETAFFDTASTANIYINVSPRYRQNPQTPFVISSQEFFISDLKVNGSADFEKDDGTRQAYTLSNSYSQTTANINTTHDALMIQGKLYAPYYEGPSSGFDAKLYYGFYCKDCQANGTLMNDLSTTGLILNSTPEFASENLKDWFVNQAENNLDPRAYWTDQRALNTARISGIGAVNQGKQDIRLSSNKGGKDKIFIKLGDISPYLLDESNVQNGGIGENVLEVNFYGKSSNWGGRSYDKNGNKTDVGQFVIDTDNVSNRTNRRIDW
ncbi:hypothetical protein [Campylobacter gastrosuis]|uniref:Uncharacterized protein n=1 Tax=Campylobacter gastrosuis TaxID=2974576 RepID=A0ABT7HN94_9BACT|nr:hypothetical protein [Campylobacter gastrosuis]MDL0087904.1 hypothetical protein [Campylobacter gastrosuis]